MDSQETITAQEMINARIDRLPMTRHMWMMIVLISLGAWFQLYDLFYTGYIAPGLFQSGIFTATTTALFGLTGLASFISSLFIGLFIGTIGFANLADRFGRRRVFTYALVWFSVATFILAFQNTVTGMNFWHIVAGIGVGVELSTVDTFLSEITPKRSRGGAFAVEEGIAYFSLPTIALLAWLLASYSPLGLIGWRWVVLVGSFGMVPIWWLRARLPESPRWLAQQGRLEEADAVVAAMEAKVAAEYGRPLPPPEPVADAEETGRGRYVEIFSPEYRARTIMLSIVNFFSTIGVYGFVNWIPTLLIAKGIEISKTLEYTFIIAMCFPLGVLAVVVLADKLERKWQIIWTSVAMAVFGVIFSEMNSPAMLILFGCLETWMSAWLALTLHIYQAELFPTRIRAQAVGFVFSWSRFSVIFAGFFVAYMLRNFGVPGVFVLISASMGVMILGIGVFGPRTSQRALEEISH